MTESYRRRSSAFGELLLPFIAQIPPGVLTTSTYHMPLMPQPAPKSTPPSSSRASMAELVGSEKLGTRPGFTGLASKKLLPSFMLGTVCSAPPPPPDLPRPAGEVAEPRLSCALMYWYAGMAVASAAAMTVIIEASHEEAGVRNAIILEGSVMPDSARPTAKTAPTRPEVRFSRLGLGPLVLQRLVGCGGVEARGGGVSRFGVHLGAEVGSQHQAQAMS